MNIQLIKLIALVTMLMDHIGYWAGPLGWNILSDHIATSLRLLGRMSFPLFAFSVSNGLLYSKNTTKYLTKLIIFSYVSQIPYSLVFYPANYDETNAKIFFRLDLINIIFLIMIVILMFYIIRNLQMHIFFIHIVLFSLGINMLKINYMWILGEDLNIFYFYTLSAISVIFINKITELKITQQILISISLILLYIFIGLRSDYFIYGIGILFVFTLYYLNKNLYLQSLVIILWSFITYGLIYHNIQNAFYSMIAALIILFYNKKNNVEKSYKFFFYLLYPIHLLTLGTFNIIIKFFL